MKIRTVLRLIGIVVWVGAIAVWLALGASKGWTQTSVQVKKFDPVTELEYVEWKKKFVPGVDFLGASLFAGTLLIGLSFLARKKEKTTT